VLFRSTGIFFLLLLGGVLLTALAFYLFVQRQMVRRLKGVSDHLDRVDDVNDLTLPVDQVSRDEIAQLIRHINGMQARLKAGISRERAMEMAMLRNENLVLTGRLAANVAHEVNNPLFSISNALQVIRQEVAGGAGADVREVIELAEREIRRVRTITRNLNDFTRINLERFTAVDLGAVISQAIRVLQLGQGMGRTQIRITGVTGPLKVSGNADSLQQVFMNLLLNASEAMGGGGQVTIEVQPGPEEWIVAIADQGPGFAPEVRERLFEPFNSSKDVKGVGLGLYISYQVVVRHNGTMRLLDDGKPGARLLIRLPRDKGEPHG
jgi:two-component system NtrC family sensor kinase